VFYKVNKLCREVMFVNQNMEAVEVQQLFGQFVTPLLDFVFPGHFV
jgi:uncharacterized integral membrane protein